MVGSASLPDSCGWNSIQIENAFRCWKAEIWQTLYILWWSKNHISFVSAKINAANSNAFENTLLLFRRRQPKISLVIASYFTSHRAHLPGEWLCALWKDFEEDSKQLFVILLWDPSADYQAFPSILGVSVLVIDCGVEMTDSLHQVAIYMI